MSGISHNVQEKLGFGFGLELTLGLKLVDIVMGIMGFADVLLVIPF